MRKIRDVVLLACVIVFVASCSTNKKQEKAFQQAETYQKEKVVDVKTKKDFITTPSSPNISVEWINPDSISLYSQKGVTEQYKPQDVIKKALDRSYQVRISELLQKQINNNKKISKTVSYVNLKDGIIAYAKNRKTAQALANKDREVFFGFKGDSVKDTLNIWAKSVGYSIIWNVDFDYKISQDFTAYGKLTAEGGALEQVLMSLQSTDNPIRATVKSNHAILIQTLGYKMSAASY
ncbi:TcpQ domain-containing protein [Francisella sp. 19X1-34]|uniref:TcpQ domain-containing protein n=1 Tax=Francisella sp. 19X1-34 TaxID=3087177 RepID=UPI002E32F0A2|nr:TcpQ domain-containing protein [Francisella sp. 19X1-34]MED7788500.1 TcpQ domain-containing protein [Francisella sp. 19X1-34]